MIRWVGVLLAASAAILASACGGTKTITVTQTVTRTVTTTQPAPEAAACTGDDLSGSFDVQVGSAGAGQITYTLRLTNSSAATCFVSGFPELQLLDAQGAALPTHAAPEPGAAALRVRLQPGASTSFDARFSPDIPGTGEQQSGTCEATASTVRVTPAGGGTLDAPIAPPTPVCEHGAIRLRPSS